MAYIKQNGFEDPEAQRDEWTWQALAFRQKDGALKVAYEAMKLSADVSATRKVLAACKTLDADSIMPILPPAPKSVETTETCEKADEALATLAPANAEFDTACRTLEARISGYAKIMDDLEAGRLACENPDREWIMAGKMGFVLNTVVIAQGCRPGTVTPYMSMISAAPSA